MKGSAKALATAAYYWVPLGVFVQYRYSLSKVIPFRE